MRRIACTHSRKQQGAIACRQSTVLKSLQIMAEKGLVRRDESQRAHVYEAARPLEWTQQRLVGDLLERAFAGSAKALVLGALSARKASGRNWPKLRLC